jgi:hypothetical protein
MKTATGSRGSLCLLDRLQDRCRKAIATADHFEASALLAEAIGFKAEEGAQKPEDALDFGGWTTPVVGGEGVESEAADADVGRVLDDATSSSQAGAMTGNTRQIATRRPAAVAVHDDGDVKYGLKIRLHMKSLPRLGLQIGQGAKSLRWVCLLAEGHRPLKAADDTSRCGA